MACFCLPHPTQNTISCLKRISRPFVDKRFGFVDTNVFVRCEVIGTKVRKCCPREVAEALLFAETRLTLEERVSAPLPDEALTSVSVSPLEAVEVEEAAEEELSV